MRTDFVRIVNFSSSAFNGCFEENISLLKTNILSKADILNFADIIILSQNFIPGTNNASLDFNSDFINNTKTCFNRFSEFLKKTFPDTCFILPLKEFCENCGKPVSVTYVTNKYQTEKINECDCVPKQQAVFKASGFSFCVLKLETTDDLSDTAQNSAVKYSDFVFLTAALPSLAGSKEKTKRFLSAISEMNKNVLAISNVFSMSNTATPYLYNGLCETYNNGVPVSEKYEVPFFLMCSVSDIDIELIRKRRMKFKSVNENNTFCITNYKLNISEKEPEFCKFEKEPYFDSNMGENGKKERVGELLTLQAMSIAGRLNALSRINPAMNKIFIGISGGLDSTTALLAATRATDILGLDRKNIVSVTMPGMGTSGRTYENAKKLIDELKTDFMEIRITPSVEQHFKDINHNPQDTSVVYENAQARERTQILMDLANKHNGIMLSTGDLSEIALGFCTFNGDHMGQLAVNACFTKTMLRHMTAYISETSDSENLKIILNDILVTPVSPELLPLDENKSIKQLTENFLGPYILHEHFLYYFLKYGFGAEKLFFYAKKAFKDEFTGEEIKKYLKIFLWRLYTNQFKRTCSPEGTIFASINMFPSSFMIPSDINPNELLKIIDTLQ